MKKNIGFTFAILTIFLSGACLMSQTSLKTETVAGVIQALTNEYPGASAPAIARGVRHAASLWRAEDGDAAAFESFCAGHYIADPAQRLEVFKKLNHYFEAITGHTNEIYLALKKHTDEATGPLHEIDRMFSAFSPDAHLMEDLYRNRIAFLIALNFPRFTLAEKNALGADWRSEDWAMARLGDIFSSRIPAELRRQAAQTSSRADLYIADYNIHMGALRDENGRKLFSDDQVLLSHWNLRDEIKANYADKDLGPHRQRLVYQVMKRIIDQTIPAAMINSAAYQWNPFTNTTTKDGRAVSLEREPDQRYEMLRQVFLAGKAIDPFTPDLPNAIERNFSGSMEVPQEQVEALFDEFLSSPLLGKIARVVHKRLGRKLAAYDIWYDGFKTRSAIPQDRLDAETRRRFPTAAAFEQAMPVILQKLGFTSESAAFLASKIAVDPARGSGHAWGAGMRDSFSRLRTRVGQKGMDYKGFNIAVHEFGHNVEQTLSLHNVPYFFLNGVPNTAFTEALAFLFQKRDLEILDMEVADNSAKDLAVLDNCWSAFEIMGVSMVDMKVWKWLYAHPEADAAQIRAAVMRIARDVWNRYFAPAYGVKDEPVLAIYSHMISYPLYLSAYAFGQLIEFQLGEYLADKPFGPEVERIWSQGRLTPSAWMIRATGSELSPLPLIRASERALKKLK